MQKVMLTLSDDLLEEIARATQHSQQNRSAFVRQAVREHLDRLKKKEREQLMAEGYRTMAKENARDAKAYSKATLDLGEDS
jgi:metal-responsive CopG/Arc/MetJ family transcriptional regulator